MVNFEVLVFAYKRPLILLECLKSLKSNALAKDVKVTICVDGLNEKDRDDNKSIQAQLDLIKIAKEGVWGKEQEVIVNESNIGILTQYFSKIDSLLSRCENLVVLEEDAIVGHYFLDYMQNAFVKYGDQPNLGMINAYTYAINYIAHKNSAYFSAGSGNKAFGVSRTFWQKVDRECKGWEALKYNKRLRKQYNTPGVDVAGILIDELENNRNNSWDSIVFYNVFSKKLLSLSPDKTLAIDNGWGDDATNCVGENMFDAKIFDANYKIEYFPDTITEDKQRKFLTYIYFAYILRFRFLFKRIKAKLKLA